MKKTPFLFLFSLFFSHFSTLAHKKNSYDKVHKRFFKRLCPSGTEETFKKKFLFFEKLRAFIPKTLDGKIDKGSLEKVLPLMEKKISWIKKQEKNLEGRKDFKAQLVRIKKIRRLLNETLKTKEQFYEATEKSVKKQIKKESKEKLFKLKSKVLNFFEEIPFLLSYSYPVPHLKWRAASHRATFIQGEKGRREKNKIYLNRQVVESGASSPGEAKRDHFQRALFDAVYDGFQQPLDLIAENLRFDLVSALNFTETSLKKSPLYHQKRLKHWGRQTKEKKDFYEKLEQRGRTLASTPLLAREDLRAFHLEKKKETYKFWARQAPLHQAIFALETILFNEVGWGDPVERRDVAQVVINRSKDKVYNSLSPKNWPDFSEAKGGGTPSLWMNVLLKEGAFSFTYFFMGESVRLYCPESTRRGRRLRQQNIALSIDLLENPSPFLGVRYFSRVSMLGRVDMTKVWGGVTPLPPRPGPRIAEDGILRKLYQKGSYTYVNHFSGEGGKRYKVLRLHKKTYTLDPSSLEFFAYRDLQRFHYFKKK